MDTGREVFFLYPPSVLEEQLVSIVVQAEYEVYLLKDHLNAARLLRHYPNAILFVNIDERIRDTTWESWIASVMESPATASVRIGVLSYNNDPKLMERYLMELSIPCGFIRLKLGLKESAKILLTVLEANEARGKRKYVRATIPENSRVQFNVRSGRDLTRGRILDISVVGMACTFDENVSFNVNDEIADMQLNLRGRNITINGRVAGIRSSGNTRVYVVMFADQVDSATKKRLHSFIHDTLQSAMDSLVAKL